MSCHHELELHITRLLLNLAIEQRHAAEHQAAVTISDRLGERTAHRAEVDGLSRALLEHDVLLGDVVVELRWLARQWWFRLGRGKALELAESIERHLGAGVPPDWRDKVWARIRTEERKS